MDSKDLPNSLATWASAAVAGYRQVSLWPEFGNTQETIVRIHLLNCLAAAGFQVRIEVAEEALRRAISSHGNPGNMKGNRGGADIAFGKCGKLLGLIEVKRCFPNSANDINRVILDVNRLKVFHELDPDITKYVVVVLGACWEKRSSKEVTDGLSRWRSLFGHAIVAIEQAGSISNIGDDCWVTLVLDASQVASDIGVSS